MFILADCEEEEKEGGGEQAGKETRPIQLIKASTASLISSGRRLQSQERTAGRGKEEMRDKNRELNATDQ